LNVRLVRHPRNHESMKAFDTLGKRWIHANLLRTYTKPGSLTHLMFGTQPSQHSLSVKLGYFGEYLCKEIIQTNPDLCLLRCGLHQVHHKKKDIDLWWVHKETVYVRELKGNMELDTDKLPATLEKMNTIRHFVKRQYPKYTLDMGILNWSVYRRDELGKGLRQIKACEGQGFKVDHWSDFCILVGMDCSKDAYYAYMREMGNMIR